MVIITYTTAVITNIKLLYTLHTTVLLTAVHCVVYLLSVPVTAGSEKHRCDDLVAATGAGARLATSLRAAAQRCRGVGDIFIHLALFILIYSYRPRSSKLKLSFCPSGDCTHAVQLVDGIFSAIKFSRHLL